MSLRNLERKFRCENLAAAEAAASQLGAIDHGILQQADYFFPAAQARLKLRIINGDDAELICYRRMDSTEARISEYTRVAIADADGLKQALTTALGEPRELLKTRHLFIYKSTRIHLDDVKRLGLFVELETVISTQSLEEAKAEIAFVTRKMKLEDAVATAYVDLL